MNKAVVQAEVQVLANNISEAVGMPVNSVGIERIEPFHPNNFRRSPFMESIECFKVEGYEGRFCALAFQDEGFVDVVIVTDNGFQVDPPKSGYSNKTSTMDLAKRDCWEHLCIPFITRLCQGITPERFSAWLRNCEKNVRPKDA